MKLGKELRYNGGAVSVIHFVCMSLTLVRVCFYIPRRKADANKTYEINLKFRKVGLTTIFLRSCFYDLVCLSVRRSVVNAFVPLLYTVMYGRVGYTNLINLKFGKERD